MDPCLEIRKLPFKERSELIKILEIYESWKRLMAIIPQYLTELDFKSDITASNPAKYRSEHFHIIEAASEKKRCPCTEILLREWGTSGRVRPALGHLRYLLEKAELLLAARYIAVDLLHQEPPDRPSSGPGAPITLTTDELDDSDSRKIENILDELGYPSSAIAEIHRQNSVNTNINYSYKDAKSVPKIIIHEAREDKPSFNFNLPVILQKTKSQEDINPVNLPDISALMIEEQETNSQNSINRSPITSLEQSSKEQERNSEDNVNRPPITALLNMSSESSVAPWSDSHSNGIALSSHLSSSNRDSHLYNVPMLSELNLSSTHRSTNHNPVPHYSYADIAKVTDDFNDGFVDQWGHYVTDKLTDRPVAIKKVHRGSSDEIVHELQHENLVSLLGVSDDGPDEYLIYEYMQGASLKEKLQKRELVWTERLYVALGIARALHYLQTKNGTHANHRFITSTNIFLDNKNKPKLSLSNNSSIVSSIYTAPEASEGEVSEKLDVYSFGVVLLELLTAIPESRDGENLVSYIQKVCPKEIAPLLDKSAGPWSANSINFGEKLYHIAQDCLKNIQERPFIGTVCNSLEELINRSLYI